MTKSLETQIEMVPLAPIIERFTVAKPLRDQEAREVYDAVTELAKQYKKVPGIDAYFTFNEETGEIRGSNLPLMVLVNKVLVNKGTRTLTFEEGMQLDKQGKLTNGVYRDFGLVVYSQKNPNSDVAEQLMPEIKRRGLVLPVLFPHVSLDLNKETGAYNFADNDTLIISGEEAQMALKRFNYKSGSGVLGLACDVVGGWVAGWSDLVGSDEVGRVDWIASEARREDFEAETIRQIESEYQAESTRYLNDLARKKQKALDLIRGKE